MDLLSIQLRKSKARSKRVLNDDGIGSPIMMGREIKSHDDGDHHDSGEYSLAKSNSV